MEALLMSTHNFSHGEIKIYQYCNNPKYWDRQAWANRADPDQTLQNVASITLQKAASNQAYMPYLTLWDKISQNLANLEDNSYKKIKMFNYNTPPIMSWANNSVKRWQNFPINNPKQITFTSMHVPSLDKIPWNLLSSYQPERKIWACLGQITLSKFDEIYPLAIPNQISTISMQTPSLVKFHWSLLVIIRKRKLGMSRADWYPANHVVGR